MVLEGQSGPQSRTFTNNCVADTMLGQLLWDRWATFAPFPKEKGKWGGFECGPLSSLPS